ncbi:LacI family transcriptional regulator [Solitalea sp. MAHUQ-68]|uniref:LacI family transcriptional regulator n=1 Tax=Solitalea agri TaxID=2953739 RepID=A0A9X2F4T6_9SPHI|nr:LacI family DNA-binding transcriptional regulator [Solitalea agri]MCO4294306.1 LacI family transcriptional regulator [Solitalea agri]
MKKVTIHDIARELNVTFSTVARALNDHPAISVATKEAVREVAKKLNYQQNKVASSLRSGRSNVIGVMVPNLAANFFNSTILGIEKVMNENGYSILLYQSGESFSHETKGIETFMQSRVEGIFASVAMETTDFSHYEDIKKNDIPLLLFDRAVEELGVPTVRIDDYRGGFLAAEHLIKHNCKNIVHISANLDVKSFRERLQGYKDALNHYNLPINEDLIFYGKPSIELGRRCIEQLYNTNEAFDGVFAFEDYTALGVMQQLKSHGVNVPEQVKVIGFANEAFGAYISPSLSTIDQQSVLMGEEVARLFLKLHKSQNFYTSIPEQIVLEPLLVERESSGLTVFINQSPISSTQ